MNLYIKYIIIFLFFVQMLGPFPAWAGPLSVDIPIKLTSTYKPILLSGVKIDPKDALKLEFLIHQPNASMDEFEVKQEANKLVKHFLASLTIPEQDLWVNLSPFEKDKIIPTAFGETGMGRDLLAQDYLLKQITASLMHPESEVGKKFWSKIYQEAASRYGNTQVVVNTFNKVWIVPEKAVVYENGKIGAAYVKEARLKVMLEEDYIADNAFRLQKFGPNRPNQNINDVSKEIIRSIILPVLEKEVNEGNNFVALRQVYNSLILASWYKKKIKDSLLAQTYANKNKIKGTEDNGAINPEEVYNNYLNTFKKGAYNFIKEEIDPVTQQSVMRKYFAGGVDFAMNATSLGIGETLSIIDASQMSLDGQEKLISFGVQLTDKAMSSTNGGSFYQRFGERRDYLKPFQLAPKIAAYVGGLDLKSLEMFPNVTEWHYFNELPFAPFGNNLDISDLRYIKKKDDPNSAVPLIFYNEGQEAYDQIIREYLEMADYGVNFIRYPFLKMALWPKKQEMDRKQLQGIKPQIGVGILIIEDLKRREVRDIQVETIKPDLFKITFIDINNVKKTIYYHQGFLEGRIKEISGFQDKNNSAVVDLILIKAFNSRKTDIPDIIYESLAPSGILVSEEIFEGSTVYQYSIANQLVDTQERLGGAGTIWGELGYASELKVFKRKVKIQPEDFAMNSDQGQENVVKLRKDIINDLKKPGHEPKRILISLRKSDAYPWGDSIIILTKLVNSLLKTWPDDIQHIDIFTDYPEIFEHETDPRIRINPSEFESGYNLVFIGDNPKGLVTDEVKTEIESNKNVINIKSICAAAISGRHFRLFTDGVTYLLEEMGLSKDDYFEKNKIILNEKKIVFLNTLAETNRGFTESLTYWWIYWAVELIKKGYTVVLNGGAYRPKSLLPFESVETNQTLEGLVVPRNISMIFKAIKYKTIGYSGEIRVQTFNTTKEVVDFMSTQVSDVITIDTGVFWAAHLLSKKPAVVITTANSFITSRNTNGYVAIDYEDLTTDQYPDIVGILNNIHLSLNEPQTAPTNAGGVDFSKVNSELVTEQALESIAYNISEEQIRNWERSVGVEFNITTYTPSVTINQFLGVANN